MLNERSYLRSDIADQVWSPLEPLSLDANGIEVVLQEEVDALSTPFFGFFTGARMRNIEMWKCLRRQLSPQQTTWLMIDALPRQVIFAHCWCVRWQSSYERLKRKLFNTKTKLAMDVCSMSPRIIFVDGVCADCTQALPSIDQCYSRVSVG